MSVQYKEIIVKGKVQGVFFRATAKQKADDLGISGKIKNQADGNVFIFAYGEKDAMEAFIAWCRKGPLRAKVDEVKISEAEPDERLQGFEVIH